MRVLVVAPQPFFSFRGTPLSVYYRTLVLTEEGAEIDFLTYGEGLDVEIPGVRIHRIPRIRWLEPIKVGPSLPKALLDVLLVLWTVARLVSRRYDVVDAHEEAVFFCRFLAPLFGCRLIYDMHSSLPQQLRNFDYTRSRLLIGAFERLEDSCLRKADAVLTISPSLARYALERMPEPGRHFLIENSIFEEVRLAERTGEGGPALGHEPELPPGRPVVFYAGTFESYQGIDLLIEGFARLRSRREDALLLLAGGRPEQIARFRELASRLGLDEHVVFTGTIERGAVHRLMRQAALLVSPRSTGINTPLKIYEMLACGVPFVATRIESHTQILDEKVCYLADPEPEAFARAMDDALGDPDRRRRVVEAAQALYERHYSRGAYTRKMRAMLAKIGLAGKNGAPQGA